jgi:hypothetical protein
LPVKPEEIVTEAADAVIRIDEDESYREVLQTMASRRKKGEVSNQVAGRK